MRLAGQLKLGFYAAHPDAVWAICQHLVPDPDRANMMTLLDPCAAEGVAVKMIGHHLGVPESRTYCVELDAGRAAKCRENLPTARVVGPASFMSTRVTPGSMSIAYVNPPFDDELGGGKRQEWTFAEQATTAIKAGGVLVLVMPYVALKRSKEFRDYLDNNYQDASIFKFPEGDTRPFNEVVYIGKKRFASLAGRGHGYLESEYVGGYEPTRVVGVGDFRVTVPMAHAPAQFVKAELTDEELVEALLASPLVNMLRTTHGVVVKRPPCDLGTGHVSLLLASGYLDGVIHPPGEPPHVVRGNARKIQYQATPTEHTTNEAGTVTTITEVWSEKITLTVRVIDRYGKITTFEGEKDSNNAVVAEGVGK